jgi:hypothetical protein
MVLVVSMPPYTNSNTTLLVTVYLDLVIVISCNLMIQRNTSETVNVVRDNNDFAGLEESIISSLTSILRWVWGYSDNESTRILRVWGWPFEKYVRTLPRSDHIRT